MWWKLFDSLVANAENQDFSLFFRHLSGLRTPSLNRDNPGRTGTSGYRLLTVPDILNGHCSIQFICGPPILLIYPPCCSIIQKNIHRFGTNDRKKGRFWSKMLNSAPYHQHRPQNNPSRRVSQTSVARNNEAALEACLCPTPYKHTLCCFFLFICHQTLYYCPLKISLSSAMLWCQTNSAWGLNVWRMAYCSCVHF